MEKFVVGLTGGIGSGKTTVAHFFSELGIDIIDADIVARQIVAPNQVAYHKIIERFGNTILLADKTLDRAKLRTIIFNDKDAKQWLNQITHPLIHQQINAQIQDTQSTYCIVAIPLLIENKLNNTHLQYKIDRILVTDCDSEMQIQRTITRDNNSIAQIKKIIAAQVDRQTRQSFADEILNTAQNLIQLEKDCQKLHESYIRLAKLKGLG